MALESIALIPSGYKATKVYSQLPVNGNGDFTFDRGTSADQTRVNKNGLIESVAVDVPRLDYLDGGCPSLLLEPASTNLVTYSEDFSNVAWLKFRSSVSNDTILSPDGSVNADKLIEDTSTDTHYVTQNIVSLTGTFTFSVFLKKAEREFVTLREFSSTGARATFDLTNGIILSEGGGVTNPKIVDYGNGWYRCSIDATLAAQNFGCGIVLSQDGTSTQSYTGDGTSGIYIYGAQLEQQSYATSYIPTSGATATRDAETCNSAGTTAEINSQEGVLFVEYKPSVDSSSIKQLSLSDGSTSNRVLIEVKDSGTTLRPYLINSTSNNQLNDFSILDTDVYYKIALVYSLSSVSFYVNGVLTDVDNGTIYTPVGLNELALDSGAGSLPFLGRTKKLSVYDQALSATELESLTGFSSFSEMKSYLSYS